MIEVTEKKDYRLVTNEMRLEFAAVSDNEAFAAGNCDDAGDCGLGR